MSRTYRKHLDCEYIVNGDIFSWKDIDRVKYPFPHGLGWSLRFKILKSRDKKPGQNPRKWFKKMNRRMERARQKQALYNNKEIPNFKKRDRWEWS